MLPEHPETILLKNTYYSNGLREIDVWDYYQKQKVKIIKEVYNRDLTFWVMVDINKPVILRKGKHTKYIRLKPAKYDELVHGRVISIHSSMNRHDDVAIIDIDCDNYRLAQIAALDVYEFVMTKVPIIETAQIRFTGKQSFHIFCTLVRRINVDSIRIMFRKFLLESDLTKKYTIEQKRTRGIPNLDLAPNKFKGNFITLHSLSIWGLRCMEVDHGKVLSFRPQHAMIQRSKLK